MRMALQDRVVSILTKPKEEWAVIAAEPTDVQKLYRDYIVPLSAILPICNFIGTSIVGISTFVGTYRVPLMTALSSAIVSYVLGLVGVYVSAVIIEKLAPTFQSQSDRMAALKLVAYASTPAWLAGVFNLIPMLAVLGIIAALYSIYLFYLGLPVMMKTPADKVIPYMAVSAVVIIVVYIVAALISGAITGARMVMP
jgi:hypothetical protein